MNRRVKLYATSWSWRGEFLGVVEATADETPNLYRRLALSPIEGAPLTSQYEAKSAFGYRTTIRKSEMAELKVGLTAEEALRLAMKDALTQLGEAEVKVEAANGRITQLEAALEAMGVEP
jgi:hypothetical protein